MTKGERIKNARKNLRMTQEELAEKTGISKQTICKYEKSTITNIPSDRIEAMATALGVTEAYILGWDEQPVLKANELHKLPQIDAMVTLMEDATEEELDRIVAVVKAMLGK